MYDPKDHPNVNRAEPTTSPKAARSSTSTRLTGGRDGGPSMRHVKALLKSRMLIGVYVAQYCINALTYFFITWFPVYLVQARGCRSSTRGFASIPAVCGFLGGILGGVVSDGLLKQGRSLSVARKVPIVVGMLLSMSMIVCNYTDSHVLVVLFMALSFFGRGRRARLGRQRRHRAAPDRGLERRAAQHVRQPLQHHDADRDRLHRRPQRLVQRRARLRRRARARRRDLLPVRRRRDPPRRAQ